MKLRKFSHALYENNIQPHVWNSFEYLKFPKNNFIVFMAVSPKDGITNPLDDLSQLHILGSSSSQSGILQ